jgi:hypothetical protein
MAKGVDLRKLKGSVHRLGVRFDFFGGGNEKATLTVNRK